MMENMSLITDLIIETKQLDQRGMWQKNHDNGNQ